jgi:hypothetical protein
MSSWCGWAQYRQREGTLRILVRKQFWLQIRDTDHSVMWLLGRAHPFPKMFWPLSQILRVSAAEDRGISFIEVVCTFGVQEFQLDTPEDHEACLRALQECFQAYRKAGNTILKVKEEKKSSADFHKAEIKLLCLSTQLAQNYHPLVKSFFKAHFRPAWITKPPRFRKFVHIYGNLKGVMTAIFAAVSTEEIKNSLLSFFRFSLSFSFKESIFQYI